MPIHTSSCHILGTRILIVIMLSIFKPKGKCLRLRINKFKYKDLKLRLMGSRDKKLLVWMLMSLTTG